MANKYSNTKSNAPQEVSADRSAPRLRKLPAVLRHSKALRAIEEGWRQAEEILDHSPLDWEIVQSMLNNGIRSDQMVTPAFKELLMDYERKGVQEAGDILLALAVSGSSDAATALKAVTELAHSFAVSATESGKFLTEHSALQ